MGLFAKVSIIDDLSLCNKIETDFVLNRFDLKHAKNFLLLKWEKFKKEYFVEVLFDGKTARLGLFMARASAEILRDLSRFIFKNFNETERIECFCCLSKYSKSYPTNNFRIELPESVDELHGRMSQKSRYNLRRSLKKLQENFGEVTFEEYDIDTAVEKKIIEEYLERKQATFDFEFDEGIEEFVKTHAITDVYVMKNAEENISIILSCEQCKVVFLENLTYNDKYKEFSPGQILYEHYLERLIEKNRKDLYLMGGDYEYKRRYGSIEDEVYSVIIYKGFKTNWENLYRPRIKNTLRSVKRKIRNTFKNSK